MTRPRLTRFQREVLADVQRLSRINGGRPVAGEDIGAPGAVAHLTEKGYLDVHVRYGPRGGERKAYTLR